MFHTLPFIVLLHMCIIFSCAPHREDLQTLKREMRDKRHCSNKVPASSGVLGSKTGAEKFGVENLNQMML